MSIEERVLRNDVASYLRGEQPSQDLLDKAPRLEEWAGAISRSPGSGLYRMTLVGTSHGHAMQPDGMQIETGEIVWLDRLGKWMRTRTKLWKLGQSAGIEIPLDGFDT